MSSSASTNITSPPSSKLPDGEQFHCCFSCGKSETEATLFRCKACRSVVYCGRQCQKADWKKHNPTCIAMQENENPPAGALPEHLDLIKARSDVSAWLAAHKETLNRVILLALPVTDLSKFLVFSAKHTPNLENKAKCLSVFSADIFPRDEVVATFGEALKTVVDLRHEEGIMVREGSGCLVGLLTTFTHQGPHGMHLDAHSLRISSGVVTGPEAFPGVYWLEILKQAGKDGKVMRHGEMVMWHKDIDED